MYLRKFSPYQPQCTVLSTSLKKYKYLIEQGGGYAQMLYPVLARDPAFSHIFLFGPVPELLAPNTFYISSLGQLSNPPVTHLKFCGGGVCCLQAARIPSSLQNSAFYILVTWPLFAYFYPLAACPHLFYIPPVSSFPFSILF